MDKIKIVSYSGWLGAKVRIADGREGRVYSEWSYRRLVKRQHGLGITVKIDKDTFVHVKDFEFPTLTRL